MRRSFSVLCALGGFAGCIDTSQHEASIDLYLAGSETEVFSGRDGVTISLTRAQLAFGPLTLCVGAQAGALCDDALAEWNGSAVVDVLDASPRRVGSLRGLTGTTRSFMYDLGFTSLLTQKDPLVLEAASELGGHSVRVEGAVTANDRTLPFRFAMVVSQQVDTDKGVAIVRSSPDDKFEHDLRAIERLLVTFDARAWFSDVDFTSAFAQESCREDGPTAVCSGEMAQLCANDGSVVRTQDCLAEGDVCVHAQGFAISSSL